MMATPRFSLPLRPSFFSWLWCSTRYPRISFSQSPLSHVSCRSRARSDSRWW
ncbi:hypothetical protein ACHAXT_000044 [Thalassiosira profunda]